MSYLIILRLQKRYMKISFQTYPKIGDANLMFTLWAFKKWPLGCGGSFQNMLSYGQWGKFRCPTEVHGNFNCIHYEQKVRVY